MKHPICVATMRKSNWIEGLFICVLCTYHPLLPPSPTSITPTLPTFFSVLNCIFVSTGLTTFPSTIVVSYLQKTDEKILNTIQIEKYERRITFCTEKSIKIK
jgi:uncharacterized membrane protein YdjX (TVP38/TMEM64 family)